MLKHSNNPKLLGYKSIYVEFKACVWIGLVNSEYHWFWLRRNIVQGIIKI